MASYSAVQLRNTGSNGEFLSGLKTFTFTNPSSSAYFVMGYYPDSTGSFTEATSSLGAFAGTYIASSSMGLVTSSFFSSVVVHSGVSSFNFTPSSAISSSWVNFRGTGEFSLVVS